MLHPIPPQNLRKQAVVECSELCRCEVKPLLFRHANPEPGARSSIKHIQAINSIHCLALMQWASPNRHLTKSHYNTNMTSGNGSFLLQICVFLRDRLLNRLKAAKVLQQLLRRRPSVAECQYNRFEANMSGRLRSTRASDGKPADPNDSKQLHCLDDPLAPGLPRKDPSTGLMPSPDANKEASSFSYIDLDLGTIII